MQCVRAITFVERRRHQADSRVEVIITFDDSSVDGNRFVEAIVPFQRVRLHQQRFRIIRSNHQNSVGFIHGARQLPIPCIDTGKLHFRGQIAGIPRQHEAQLTNRRLEAIVPGKNDCHSNAFIRRELRPSENQRLFIGIGSLPHFILRNVLVSELLVRDCVFGLRDWIRRAKHQQCAEKKTAYHRFRAPAISFR